MSKFQQVEDQVKEAIKNGTNLDVIKQSLIKGGYNESDISEILLGVNNSETPVVDVPEENVINDSPVVQDEIVQPAEEAVAPPAPIVEESAPIINESPEISQTPEEIVSPAPSTSQVSTPMNNSFSKPAVETSNEIPEKSVEQQPETIFTEESNEKKGGLLKVVVIVLVVLGIGAGSVFGYSKYDPFFLKSQEAILGSIITNSQEVLIEGGYTLSIDNKYSFSDGEMETKISVPIEYRTEKKVEGEISDMHLLVGDVDISPITDMMFMGGGEDVSSIINIELKYADKGFFVIVNKLPGLVGQMFPVDSFVAKWIKFEPSDVEDAYGEDIPVDEYKDKKDEIIAIYSNAIINNSNAEISSKKEGSGRLITYSANLNELYQAFKTATDEVAVMLEEPKVDFLGEDDVEGTIKIDVLVNNNFVIEKFDVVTSAQHESGKTMGESRGSIVIDDSLDITAPKEVINIEEVMEAVMSSFMEGMIEDDLIMEGMTDLSDVAEIES